MTDHRCFTVDTTSFLRNLNREDLRERCVAIHYQSPPVRNEDAGTTRIGLRFPMLIIAGYLEKPDEVAQRVADVLEKHWDEPTDDRERFPEPPLPDEQLANGGACS